MDLSQLIVSSPVSKLLYIKPSEYIHRSWNPGKNFWHNFKKLPSSRRWAATGHMTGDEDSPRRRFPTKCMFFYLTEPPSHTGRDCSAGAASHQVSSLQAIIRALASVVCSPGSCHDNSLRLMGLLFTGWHLNDHFTDQWKASTSAVKDTHGEGMVMTTIRIIAGHFGVPSRSKVCLNRQKKLDFLFFFQDDFSPQEMGFPLRCFNC